MVAHTQVTTLSLNYLTKEEQTVVQKLSWLSLEEIMKIKEVIFLVLLPQYLPSIIQENYPKTPLTINLAELPSPPS